MSAHYSWACLEHVLYICRLFMLYTYVPTLYSLWGQSDWWLFLFTISTKISSIFPCDAAKHLNKFTKLIPFVDKNCITAICFIYLVHSNRVKINIFLMLHIEWNKTILSNGFNNAINRQLKIEARIQSSTVNKNLGL